MSGVPGTAPDVVDPCDQVFRGKLRKKRRLHGRHYRGHESDSSTDSQEEIDEEEEGADFRDGLPGVQKDSWDEDYRQTIDDLKEDQLDIQNETPAVGGKDSSIVRDSAVETPTQEDVSIAKTGKEKNKRKKKKAAETALKVTETATKASERPTTTDTANKEGASSPKKDFSSSKGESLPAVSDLKIRQPLSLHLEEYFIRDQVRENKRPCTDPYCQNPQCPTYNPFYTSRRDEIEQNTFPYNMWHGLSESLCANVVVIGAHILAYWVFERLSKYKFAVVKMVEAMGASAESEALQAYRDALFYSGDLWSDYIWWLPGTIFCLYMYLNASWRDPGYHAGSSGKLSIESKKKNANFGKEFQVTGSQLNEDYYCINAQIENFNHQLQLDKVYEQEIAQKEYEENLNTRAARRAARPAGIKPPVTDEKGGNNLTNRKKRSDPNSGHAGCVLNPSQNVSTCGSGSQDGRKENVERPFAPVYHHPALRNMTKGLIGAGQPLGSGKDNMTSGQSTACSTPAQSPLKTNKSSVDITKSRQHMLVKTGIDFNLTPDFDSLDEWCLEIKADYDRGVDEVAAPKLALPNGTHYIRHKYCWFCREFQPLRTKHCRQCKKCVRVFDHHCPWTGNCVGEATRPFFLVYVLAEAILCCIFFRQIILETFWFGGELPPLYPWEHPLWTGLGSSLIDSVEGMDNMNPERQQGEANAQLPFLLLPHLIAVFLAGIFFTGFTVALSLQHLYLISANLTSWEWETAVVRLEPPEDETDERQIKQFNSYFKRKPWYLKPFDVRNRGSPFSGTFRHNVAMIFVPWFRGSEFLEWLFVDDLYGSVPVTTSGGMSIASTMTHKKRLINGFEQNPLYHPNLIQRRHEESRELMGKSVKKRRRDDGLPTYTLGNRDAYLFWINFSAVTFLLKRKVFGYHLRKVWLHFRMVWRKIVLNDIFGNFFYALKTGFRHSVYGRIFVDCAGAMCSRGNTGGGRCDLSDSKENSNDMSTDAEKGKVTGLIPLVGRPYKAVLSDDRDDKTTKKSDKKEKSKRDLNTITEVWAQFIPDDILKERVDREKSIRDEQEKLNLIHKEIIKTEVGMIKDFSSKYKGVRLFKPYENLDPRLIAETSDPSYGRTLMQSAGQSAGATAEKETDGTESSATVGECSSAALTAQQKIRDSHVTLTAQPEFLIYHLGVPVINVWTKWMRVCGNPCNAGQFIDFNCMIDSLCCPFTTLDFCGFCELNEEAMQELERRMEKER